MNIIDSIKSKYTKCCIGKCEEKGCRMGLRNMRKHICLKGEKLSRHTICDCLLFCADDNLITSAIELKSGSWGLNEVVKQLSNGASIILKIMREGGVSIMDIEFYPILMHIKGPNNASEAKKLRQTKIVFNQNKYSLLPHKCGTEFLKIRKLYKS